MTSNPLGLQLYTVRDQLASGRSAVLEAIRGFGYAAVEPYDVLTDPEALRADLDEAGLAVCAVHAKALGDDADAFLDGARTVGADTVIVPWADPERFADADAIGGLARELNEAAARAAGRGLRFGYHNHAFELALVDGRTGLEALADALDPAVLLEVDTYWAAVGGQDVPALLGRLGDRVRYLHVKDGPVTKDDPMTAVGGGRMPVAEILAACPSAEWHVVELDRCATDVLTAVRDSLDWLTSHGLATAVPAR
ncbi:MAG TPA: sugar phosphate isomerase/epimerase [Trebonia sp.]|nr:sugar phosphate isomerase/epimerase [Trebonia sp.]